MSLRRGPPWSADDPFGKRRQAARPGHTSGGARASADGTAERRAVRVLLVDGIEVVRVGLETILSESGGRVEMVAHVSPIEDVEGTVRDLTPDVVLAYFGAGGYTSLTSVGEMLRADPSLRVVVLSEPTDEGWMFEALRLGVTGYLLRSVDSFQLVDTLVRASDGTQVVDPSLAARMAITAARAMPAQGWAGSELGLTKRQGDVLKLLSQGLNNREIAGQLIVGEETVKTHLRQLYKVLGVKDRTQAVAFALGRGVFQTETFADGPVNILGRRMD